MKEKKKMRFTLFSGILVLIIVAIICAGLVILFMQERNKIGPNGKIDDWEFKGTDDGYGISGLFNGGTKNYSSQIDPSSFGAADLEAADSSIGFSTGGAKDVENFRKNIESGYFPISTDITYNGIFYDYVFDTGKKEESTELFSPSYSTAISKDPISKTKEYYMTVGLNSNIKQSDFTRKKLNLVVVLDISGSMSSGFDSYYYDMNNEDKETKSKMQIANESVNILIDQLKDDDRFGMVLFDDNSYLGKPISLISETDVSKIKKHILEIKTEGGTNFEAGYSKGTELFAEYKNVNSDEYENRIIVITDAMPNTGNTSDTGLLGMVKKNATEKIYTTFIGVGVDFNTKLIETISDVRGANYYSVHNADEFKERMGEQFEYMVTPLVFDLKLNLSSEDYEIESVYGSDTANKENGNIMHVNTLFPSKTTSTGEVKGGVVLLKLKKKSENENSKINLTVSYEDRTGRKYENSQTVEYTNNEEHYDNTGIRKAIVLTRYVNVLKNWILYERTESPRFIILPAIGIMDCNLSEEEVFVLLGEHERTSVALKVSDTYKEIFKQLKQYILEETREINDETLNQETNLLDLLINK